MSDPIPAEMLARIHSLLYFGGKWHARKQGSKVHEYHQAADPVTAIRMAVCPETLTQPTPADDVGDLF